MNSTESTLRAVTLEEIAGIVSRNVAEMRIHPSLNHRVVWLYRGIFARLANAWTDASWPEIAKKANDYWPVSKSFSPTHSQFATSNNKGRWTFGRFSPDTVFDAVTRCEADIITTMVGPCHASLIMPRGNTARRVA